MRFQKTAIQFAKAPVLGQVKTRLQTQLSAEEALAVHCELTALTFSLLTTTTADQINLQIAGAIDDNFFAPYHQHPKTQVQAQVDGDLGVKMCVALNQALCTSDVALLVGSDCPVLTREVIERAFHALLTQENPSDLVLIPAEDGGYVLIGSRQPLPEQLFEGVEWGGSKVLKQSLACIERAGLSVITFEPLWDIDRPEDLRRWRALSDALFSDT